ncbi:uncharacterized protein LOC115444167 [Manduca sexta]|uniref:uncharacterized protein LOC115444167 n=1 Tax=Manduca sexta TaxID=7130 RepID=UPI00188E1AA8|nr:uncharacterized protein LOC115444167 [Manduca sexta]
MELKVDVLLLVLLVMVCCESMNLTGSECPNVKACLSCIRKRRHLTFPDKSNVVLTISLVKAFMTHAPSGWNIALEIDVLFPLPDSKFTNSHFRKKIHNRQKRQFWKRMERAIDFHNLNGRSCVLRSICEAQKSLAPPGSSLVHDILRAIFTVPVNDEEFNSEMRGHYDELTNPNFCEMTNDCPFSLLHFVLSLNQRGS